MLRLIILAAALLFSTPSKADWPLADMNAAIDQTNFVVNRGCSGTLIDLKNRYILTAAHCVTDQYETLEREVVDDKGIVTKEKYRKLIDGSVTQIVFTNGEAIRTIVYRTNLKAVDAEIDLAVLQINGPIPNTSAAKMAPSEPGRGERVFVVGNPMGMLYSSVVAGLVSSNDRTYGILGVEANPHKRLMQISAGVIGGNSGGSVYNANGEFVGVPVMAHRTNEILGFAVPLDVIKAFLLDKKVTEPAPTGDMPPVQDNTP